MNTESHPSSLERADGNSKLIVKAFFDVFSTGDVQAIAQCLHEDLRWWVAGSLPGLSGTYDKSGLCALLGGVASAYAGGALPMTVVAMIAEGDRVAAEVQCRAVLHNGRVYDNQLHASIQLLDGKVWRVREYLDTAHCHATFLAP